MKYIVGLLALVCLTACRAVLHPEIHDETLSLKQHQYEELLLRQEPSRKKKKRAYASVPVLPASMKRKISIHVSEDVPVKTLLLQMAEKAKVNMVMSPTIVGSLHYHADNERFIDIAQAICDLVGLRYQIQGQTIRFEPDEPYMQTYRVQFPNLMRENKNRISTATDIFTAVEGGQREFDNGSSTILSMNGKTDFWQEVTDNVGAILEFNQGEGNPLPYRFTINRQAGLINIFAPFSVQQKVQGYLDELLTSSQQQVLIEAKIVEVNLSKEYQSGINWQSLEKDFKLAAPLGAVSVPGKLAANHAMQRNVVSLGFVDKNLSTLASFLNKFGTVRTLSSPRLTVMNNQSAMLKVATNFVFFKINYSREFVRIDDNRNAQDLERASSQIQTVPIGLVLTVQPTVDRYTERITLAMRPTISRVVSEKEDPAVAILSKQEKQSYIPEVQVRELDSVLQLSSGETIIMGGLMEERHANERQGVPIAQDIPIVGSLMGAREDRRSITELVVLLKATLLDEPEIDLVDRRIYNTFTKDSRPIV